MQNILVSFMVLLFLWGCDGAPVKRDFVEKVLEPPRGPVELAMMQGKSASEMTSDEPDRHEGHEHNAAEVPDVSDSNQMVLTPEIMQSAILGGFSWTTPIHWQQQESSGMRLTTFRLKEVPVKDFDGSIIVLGGQAGGMRSNIERWMGQIGQDPFVSQEAFEEFLQSQLHFETNANEKGVLISLVPDDLEAAAIETAILSLGEKTVFIKLTGAAKHLKNEHAHLLELAKSVTRKELDG